MAASDCQGGPALPRVPVLALGLAAATDIGINAIDHKSKAADSSVLTGNNALIGTAGLATFTLSGGAFPNALEQTAKMGAARGAATGAALLGGFVAGDALSRAIGI